MKKVIEVNGLYKFYRVGDSVVRALNGVDFTIHEGEFCAIVGTSGSGICWQDWRSRQEVKLLSAAVTLRK